jgi:hypothetical protein
MLMLQRTLSSLLILSLLLTSCYRVDPVKIEPGFNNQITHDAFAPSVNPFPKLSEAEAESPWGQEYLIGQAFSKDYECYRAITSYKRALILLNDSQSPHYLNIHYHIFLSYYFGGQHAKAIKMVEFGSLSQLPLDFPANEDLKIVLIDCYKKDNQTEKAERILQILEDKKKVSKAQAFLDLSSPSEKTFKAPLQLYQPLINTYRQQALSVEKAQTLNAIMPGAGYWYVGQKQSALTSFLLNSLFLAASIGFFKNKQYAAGLITTGFEAGWYFGGVYGSGLAARQHNQQLFHQQAKPYMEQEKIFPILFLEYTF